jgi:hypothetical protein
MEDEEGVACGFGMISSENVIFLGIYFVESLLMYVHTFKWGAQPLEVASRPPRCEATKSPLTPITPSFALEEIYKEIKIRLTINLILN